MAPDRPSEAPRPSGTGAPRVGFREEPGRLTAANARLGIAFSTATGGTILSLRHRQTQVDVIDAKEAMAEGYLWRLRLAAGRRVTEVTSRDAELFKYALEDRAAESAFRLRFTWSGLRAGDTSVPGQVKVLVTLPAEHSPVLFEIEAELPDELSVQAIEFPCLSALGPGDRMVDEALFLPSWGGMLLPDPRRILLTPGASSRWEASYPGRASLQMMGYSYAGRTTAVLASRDRTGARKQLVATGMPHTDRLLLWISHEAARGDEGSLSPGYATAIDMVEGDWFDAAREYRAWATEQPWCSRGRGAERGIPASVRAEGLRVSHWGGAQGAAGAVRELHRSLSIPLKLDRWCWHHCARDGAYPDYFPPRDDESVLRRAKGQLAESGIRLHLGMNGLLASPESESWQSEGAEAYALRLSPAARRAWRGLAPMCPATPYWREKLAEIARGLLAEGAEGIYLEDLARAEPVACGEQGHGHGLPLPSQWVAGVRMALTAVRAAVGREISMAVDGPSENYLDLADVMFSPQPAAEREGLGGSSLQEDWSPIPLFSAVYHEYTTLVAAGCSLVNHRGHDPLWSAEVIEELRQPLRLMERDYQAQFCLQAARAHVWGHQLMIENYLAGQARHQQNGRKLAFVGALLRSQSWGVGKLLCFSEFLGPLEIDCPPIDVPCLVNPRDSRPEDRRVIRRYVPPIMGSAWLAPGAGPALVFVNWHDQPVEFACRLHGGRIPHRLPLQLSGRAFSEEGEVLSPALRASGSEIGGEIPKRCVVLVSLE